MNSEEKPTSVLPTPAIDEPDPDVAPQSAPQPTTAHPPGQRRFTWLLAAGMLLVAVAATAVLLGAAAGKSDSGDPEERVLSVTVRPVEAAASYVVAREFIGKVEAERNSALAFERDGLVDHVEVREGDAVAAGQVIARLDIDKLQARRAVLESQLARERATLAELQAGPRAEVIAASRADLARWQSELRLARITTERRTRLIEQNAVSRQEYDDARLREESLVSQVAAAQAQLDELLAGTRQEQLDAQAALVQQTESEIQSLDVDVAKSTLVAPYPGVVAARHVDEGEVVAAGTAVVELIEMPRLRVRVGVSGEAADALRPGQSIDVLVRDVALLAQVTAIRPDRNDLTRTVTILARLEKPPATVKVGDLATVTLERPVQRAGFWLPVAALTEGTRGLWTCYVAEPLDESAVDAPSAPGEVPSKATHRISSRPVELLHVATDRAYVVGPLVAGELIVDRGLHRLVPNQAVVLADSTDQPRGSAAP